MILNLYTRREVADIIEATVTATLEKLGVSSGEISYHKGQKTYGRWFIRAVQDGRLSPVRTGNGAKSMKVYSVEDILLLRAEDNAKASIQ